MERKKEIAIFIAIILFCGFWRFSGAQQVYTSPEKVLYACEKGLHYGPSEKVLMQYKGDEDGEIMVIGKINDRELSVVTVERTMLGMYKLRNGGVVAHNPMRYETDRIVTGYDAKLGIIYGLTDLENADTISCMLQHKNNQMEDFEISDEIKMEVDSDGFFYASFPRVDNESWYYTINEKAYDKDGKVIYNQIR